MSTEHAGYPQSEPPPISAELEAMRMLLEAHLRSMKPKARLRFQRALADVTEEITEAPTPLRNAPHHAATITAQRSAQTWVRRGHVRPYGSLNR
jgi:hypothetical protein